MHQYFLHFRKVLLNLCNNNDARDFQYFPRDLANVNEWKIMFDPSVDNAGHCQSMKCLCPSDYNSNLHISYRLQTTIKNIQNKILKLFLLIGLSYYMTQEIRLHC